MRVQTHSKQAAAGTVLFMWTIAIADLSGNLLSPANAQSPAGPASVESARAGDTGAGTPAGQPLKGAAQRTVLQTAAGIKAIGEGVHKLKRTAEDMIGELQRQDLVVVSEPDVIGPIVLPAIPEPSGMLPIGDYLPPRKKWLDFYMAQMQHLIPCIQDELANTIIPEDKKAETQEPWAKMQSIMQDVESHYQRLQPLTQGPKFDSDAIGKEALAIYDDIRQLEKLRKQVFHLIKEKA